MARRNRVPESVSMETSDAREAEEARRRDGDRFATSRNFLATDKVPDTIFGYPVVSQRENYTQADIAFFEKHPEAGGYYDLGEGSPEDGTEEGAPVQADEPMRNAVPVSVSMETPKAKKAEEQRRRQIRERRRAEEWPSVSVRDPRSTPVSVSAQALTDLRSGKGGQGDADMHLSNAAKEALMSASFAGAGVIVKGATKAVGKSMANKIEQAIQPPNPPVTGTGAVTDIANTPVVAVRAAGAKDTLTHVKGGAMDTPSIALVDKDTVPDFIKPGMSGYGQSEGTVVTYFKKPQLDAARPNSVIYKGDGHTVPSGSAGESASIAATQARKRMSGVIKRQGYVEVDGVRYTDMNDIPAFNRSAVKKAVAQGDANAARRGPNVVRPAEGETIPLETRARAGASPEVRRSGGHNYDELKIHGNQPVSGSHVVIGNDVPVVTQKELAETLTRQGATVEQIPPGADIRDYLKRVQNRPELQQGAKGGKTRGAYPGSLNNPGNTGKHAKNDRKDWTGEIDSPHARWAKFDKPQNGLRAAAVAMRKIADGALKPAGKPFTIRNYAYKYAPPEENDTEAYIRNISRYSGLDPDAELDRFDEEAMARLLKAKVRFESGVPHSEWFTDDEYREAAEALQEGAYE